MRLSTAEKFILIAQHPDKGRFILSDLHVNYGIIGAILLEMSIENKVIIENDCVILKNIENNDNQFISEISVMISNSKKPRKIKYWLTKLSGKSRRYKWIILNDLVNKKIIRIENKLFLGFVPYKRSYLIDNITRDNLIQGIRSNVLFHKELTNENVVLLGLIEACKMHKIITSDKDELKKLKGELKIIIKESPIADTVDKTIKQVQAAIIGAIVASTVASSAGASH